MKKLLSALLIATMLIASVTCALAVSAEETSPATQNYEVITDVLSKIQPTETADFKVEKVDGGVKVTFKNDVAMYKKGEEESNAANPLGKVCDLADVVVDVSETAYIQMAFTTDSTLSDTNGVILHYTRKDKGDKYADLFFTSLLSGDQSIYASEDKKEAVWDLGAYISGDANKVFEDKKHAIKEFVIYGAKDTSFTITKLAIVKPATVVEPSDSTSSDASTSEASSTETSSTETTTSAESTSAPASSSSAPASSSSSAPGTGDTGMIVFAVLAVLAAVGGVAVVRARH